MIFSMMTSEVDGSENVGLLGSMEMSDSCLMVKMDDYSKTYLVSVCTQN
jgi:hypothetical protein